MIKAAVFDVDGTLIDSNDLHAAAWQETFRHFGKEIPYGDLRRQIGKGGDQYLPVFLSEDELRRFGKEAEDFRAQLYKQKYLPRARPFPKVRELFQRVHQDGKRIALASSGKEQELQHYQRIMHVEGLVDVQTTKDEVEHSKPAPDIFGAALASLGQLSPNQAIVVGDTPYDIEAAQKAQLATIALLSGGFPEDDLRAAGAVAIYRDPADLLARYETSPLP